MLQAKQIFVCFVYFVTFLFLCSKEYKELCVGILRVLPSGHGSQLMATWGDIFPISN